MYIQNAITLVHSASLWKSTEKKRKISRSYKLAHNQISGLKISEKRLFYLGLNKFHAVGKLFLKNSAFICCSIINSTIANGFLCGTELLTVQKRNKTAAEIPLKANNINDCLKGHEDMSFPSKLVPKEMYEVLANVAVPHGETSAYPQSGSTTHPFHHKLFLEGNWILRTLNENVKNL